MGEEATEEDKRLDCVSLCTFQRQVEAMHTSMIFFMVRKI